MASRPTYEELVAQVASLQQENETLKSKCPTKVDPASELEEFSSITDLSLKDIIDISRIQSMMEDFSTLTGMVTALLDLEGNILVNTGWQEICLNFHRKNPVTAKACAQSDLHLKDHVKKGEFTGYKCANGLWDVVTPLYVGDHHLGNMYTGQFFYDDEPLDEDHYIEQAEKCGFPVEEYLKSLKKVPRHSRDTIDRLMNFLVKFTAYVSEISLINFKIKFEKESRITAEKALKKSEVRLRTIIRSLPDLVWLKDSDGVYIFSNPRIESMFGQDEDELCGKTDFDFLPQDLAEFFRNNDRLAIEAGVARKNEEEVTFACDSHKEVLETIKTPIFDEEHNLLGVLGIGRDITIRKTTEKALLDSEKKYRQLFHKLPVPLIYGGIIFDDNHQPKDFRIIEANEALREMAFPPNLDVANKTLRELYPGKTDKEYLEDFHIEIYGRVAANVETFGNVVYSKELSKWLYLSVYSPKRGFFVASYIDISEQKHNEEQLTRTQVYLNSILNSIPDPVFVKDSDHRWTTVNDAFCKMVGRPREKLLGLSDMDVFPEDQVKVFWEHDDIVMASDKADINEEQFESKDGVRTISTVKASFDNPNTGKRNLVGTIRDITEELRLKEELRQAQKMESLGRLAGGVAHDYNNALSVIIGYTELVMFELKDSDPMKADLEEVILAATKASEITRQLLVFATKQPISPKILNLNETIPQMLKMLKRLIGENIALRWQEPKSICNIRIDPTQINQILTNLCVNSRDAIKDTGTISITAEEVSFDDEYCQSNKKYQPGEFLNLTISDSGSGISPEIIENLFDPFFTTKGIEKGTGLGLSTVYGIVKQNRGFIIVDSNENSGTSISVFLPRASEEKNVAVEIAPSLPGACNELILLVEDEKSILNLVSKILNRLGYRVITANTPKKAIEEAHNSEERISLLLSDVIMPEINGRELSDQLTARYPTLKTVFMSGYPANAIEHHGVLGSGCGFVQKPFTKKVLAETIRMVLDKES